MESTKGNGDEDWFPWDEERPPADAAPPAGQAPETITNIPAALRGVPGPWDEAVAPASQLSPPAHRPDTSRTRGPAANSSTSPVTPSPPPAPVTPVASSTPTVSDPPMITDAPTASGRPGHSGQPEHPGHPSVSGPMPERSGHTLALAVPGAAGTPGEPPTAVHELSPPPYAPGPGHAQPSAGPPGTPPTAKRPGGPSGKTMTALMAAGSAIVVAAIITLAFSRLGGSSDAPCSGSACARTQQKSTTAPAAPAGPRLHYRTVDRETGYFEGTITIVNPGKSPMNGWTLSFTYPGADIHNVWEAVLQRKGETVTIVNAMTAAPIAPGERFEVQFGGAGHPTMPTGCRLNNAPCVFVR